MNDVELPRIICGGLIVIALAAIAATCLIVCKCDTTTSIIATVLTTLLVISSNVVSGLLGYVTATVTIKEPK